MPDTRADQGPLAREVGFLVVRIGAAAMRMARAHLRPLGLHVRSYSVLALAGEGGGRTQREVADYLDLDPSQVVSLVDELEGQGLVTREVVPGDRRSRLIRATDQGCSVLEAGRLATAAAESETLGALTAEERETLVRLLQRAALPLGSAL